MIDPDALYELEDEPVLDDPVLIMGLEGWIDAGIAANAAANHLVSKLDTMLIAEFDADTLLDHRSRRPVMRLVDGVARRMEWPGIELRAATDDAGNDLLLLVGAEPDHFWRAFSEAVIDLARRFGTKMIVGLGAYPAPLPHTRPSRLAATATTEYVGTPTDWVRGTLDVPAGVQAAIEQQGADAGIPALGIWAQVPHYAAAMPYPPATVALLEGLGQIAGLATDLTALRLEADACRVRLDELVANSDEHRELVHQLERYVDNATQEEQSLPSGDELAAEIQRFLNPEG